MQYSATQLNQTGVYMIVHRDSGRLYIGSTAGSFKQRWRIHKSYLRKGKHHSLPLQNAWNKYSEFAFDFIILEVVPKEEWLDDQYLTDIEQMWLDAYQSYSRANGYNICITAGSQLGLKRSEEAKQKMSEAKKGEKNYFWGKTLSEEHCRKMSEAQKGEKSHMWGKSPSEETRKKMSEAKKGKKGYWAGKSPSEETIKKLSKTYTFLSPVGDVVTFHNLNDYCRENGLDQSAMCKVAKGLQGHHKGWRFSDVALTHL